MSLVTITMNTITISGEDYAVVHLPSLRATETKKLLIEGIKYLAKEDLEDLIVQIDQRLREL